MTFCLKLRQNLRGKSFVAGLVGGFGALDALLNLGWVKNGLVAKRSLQGVGQVACAGKTVDWLFGQALVNYPAQRLIDVWIQLRDRRWDELQHRFNGLLDGGARKRLPPGESLVQNDPHREQVRSRSDLPHRGLLGRHVLESALLSSDRFGARQVHDAEVDDLC